MKHTIPIVIAFTPNYFIPAVTCLHSIFLHTKDNEQFHVICLLSEELPEWQKEKIQLIGVGQANYSFLGLQGKLKDVYVDSRYTEAASYRLLLPELLPEYDKIIYIDCDVIVRNDLAKLYHTINLENNYLAGVFEATLDFQKSHLRELGCNPGEYINSGFLIMNLALLREDGMVEKLIDALKTDYLEFPDQDVLNVVCKGRILGLPPYYNGIRTFYLPQYKKIFLQRYTEEDWNEVQRHGTIHYTGGKPWNQFTVEFGEWWKYYEMLPAEIRKKCPVNKKMYYLYKLYRTKIGALLVDSSRTLYRYLKY